VATKQRPAKMATTKIGDKLKRRQCHNNITKTATFKLATDEIGDNINTMETS